MTWLLLTAVSICTLKAGRYPPSPHLHDTCLRGTGRSPWWPAPTRFLAVLLSRPLPMPFARSRLGAQRAPSTCRSRSSAAVCAVPSSDAPPTPSPPRPAAATHRPLPSARRPCRWRSSPPSIATADRPGTAPPPYGSRPACEPYRKRLEPSRAALRRRSIWNFSRPAVSIAGNGGVMLGQAITSQSTQVVR